MGKVIRITGTRSAATPTPIASPTPLITSSASNLNLQYTQDYIFNGSQDATWNLPSVDASKKGRSYQMAVKNNGIGLLTIPSNGLTDGAENVVIPTGFSVTIFPTGTGFTLISTNS